MPIKPFDPNAGLDELLQTAQEQADHDPSSAVDAMRNLGSSAVEAQLAQLQDDLKNLPEGASEHQRALLVLQIGQHLVELERGKEAWEQVRPQFDAFIRAQDWEKAAEACDCLYLADQKGSLSALGQGIWLSVTFPVDPQLSIGLLSHIIDDTPDESDGAAVAAATAHYIADLRTAENSAERNNLVFFTSQMLGNVARRHSEIENQQQFDFWMERMELTDPSKFLIRLRNVVDVLVQTDWWFNREKLQEQIPED